MTDKTALRQLIEAVEGDNNPEFEWGHCIQALGNKAYLSKMCVDAYHGSLDAAKALHEALLPDGFWYDVEPGYAIVYDEHGINDWQTEKNDTDCPARAWLIAILKAYEART